MAERRTVDAVVVGSNPIIHPSLVEHMSKSEAATNRCLA